MSEFENKISENCYSLLKPDNLERKNVVIFLLTSDYDGFPRICLLSPFQVVSVNLSELCFEVYTSSHTKKNLEERRKATMIMPEGSGLLYVRGETDYKGDLQSEGEEPQSLFSMKVFQATRDVSKAAPITSEITFDISVIGPMYRKNFESLVSSLGS